MEKERKPNGYWTKERVFEEARKYTTRTAFKNGGCGAYTVACKNGWIDEMDWLVSPQKPKGYWTKERVLEEAQKYHTSSEFMKSNPGVYTIACKKGWIGEITWFESPHKQHGYWSDKENVFEEGRKYTTRSEFKEGSGSAFYSALKHNWLDEMDWLENGRKKPRKLSKEFVFEKAKECSSAKEFRDKYQSAYSKACTEGWIEEMVWLYEDCARKGFWHVKENVFNEARKYRTRSEFCKKCPGGYKPACENGWIDEMDWFVKTLNPCKDPMYIVYRYVFKEFNTVYIGITMRKDTRNCHHHHKGPVYNFAKSNNIEVPEMEVLVDGIYQKDALEREGTLVSFCKNIGLNVLNKAKTGVGCGSLGGGIRKWTESAVMKEARKYKTRSEFAKHNDSAYRAALRNNLLDKMDWFKSNKKPKGYWTFEHVALESKKYETKTDFQKGSYGAYKTALRNDWLDMLFNKAS